MQITKYNAYLIVHTYWFLITSFSTHDNEPVFLVLRVWLLLVWGLQVTK